MKQQFFGIILVFLMSILFLMPQTYALESTVTGVNTQGNSQVYKRLQQFIDGKIDQLKRRLEDLTNREATNRTFIETMSGRCSSGEAVKGVTSSGSIQCDPVIIEWLDVYHWDAGDWGTCSETCGGGTQNRVVSCRNQNGQVVSDGNCEGTKPDTSRDCNIQACPITSNASTPAPTTPTPSVPASNYTYGDEFLFTSEVVMSDCTRTTQAMSICGNVNTGQVCTTPGLCVTRIVGKNDSSSIWGGGGCSVYTRICE